MGTSNSQIITGSKIRLLRSSKVASLNQVIHQKIIELRQLHVLLVYHLHQQNRRKSERKSLIKTFHSSISYQTKDTWANHMDYVEKINRKRQKNMLVSLRNL